MKSMLNTLDGASEVVFLGWILTRLWFHVASGHAGWSAAFGAGAVFSTIVVIAHFID